VAIHRHLGVDPNPTTRHHIAQDEIKKKLFYSNSIVAGGLSVMSYKHLTTEEISVVMRLEIFVNSSNGTLTAVAVTASSE